MDAPETLTCLGKQFTLVKHNLMEWGNWRCEYKSPGGVFEIQIDYQKHKFDNPVQVNLWVDRTCVNLPKKPLQDLTLHDIRLRCDTFIQKMKLQITDVGATLFEISSEMKNPALDLIEESIRKADPRFTTKRETTFIRASWDNAAFGNRLEIHPQGQGFKVDWKIYRNGEVIAGGHHQFLKAHQACRWGANSILQSLWDFADVDFKKFEN